jgi:ATP-dependent protease ClpP protease subunit
VEQMSKNKFPKSVSFNVTNEEDVKILKYVEKINFSGYVKQLILADMQKQEQALKIVKKSEGGGIKIVVGR